MNRELPTIDEVIFAITQDPLGEGAEAKVYKIHTNPDYTVRMRSSMTTSDMSKLLSECKIERDNDLFKGRNFGQTAAYFKKNDAPEKDEKGNPVRGELADDLYGPYATINRYCPGFSYEISKTGKNLTAEEILNNTQLMTKKILEIPDKAIDGIYDDLHFLSARKHTIDAGTALFTNTGNVLYSAVHQRLFIIDLQPFIYDEKRVPMNHTKGFNSPLYLARALLPGSYSHRMEHSKNEELIQHRTEIVERVISGGERNNLNDGGNYLGVDVNKSQCAWEYQLRLLNVPVKYHENMVGRLMSIKDVKRYSNVPVNLALLSRVQGRSLSS